MMKNGMDEWQENYNKSVANGPEPGSPSALRAEIDRLRAALQQCAAEWSSSPGTVMSAAAEVNAEFQRRMQIAADALHQQSTASETGE